MKIKDIQFARYFLTQEINAPTEVVQEILSRTVEISFFGEPDTVIDRGQTITYQNPSSITMFLFNLLYSLLKGKINEGTQQDKLGLALLFLCRDYVYADFSTKKLSGPPAIVGFDKISIPSSIVRNLVEPLIGKMEMRPLLFVPCKFTDACRIVETTSQLESEYKFPLHSISNSDFPLVIVNRNIHNDAARLAHLTIKSMELSVGTKKTEKIIQNLLLGDSSLPESLLQILKVLKGDPLFFANFLKYFELGTIIEQKDYVKIHSIQSSVVESDEYLNKHIKVAAPPNTAITKQWSQWSMLMGLIEKQLEPMRGSMWPASENIKPHEDRFRLMVKERTKEKGKNQANFEELLETSRDLYDHNAIEPGQLIETLLKENRAWKA
ncbi:hypothetical protein LCGC14_0661700 [marine sediment metagenome]|uniref:Uncharacterized protein n=1 Tax=marine sediment metagenome TaxID=412755 RepID=A0A0F9QTD5_9ZZZZ